MTATYNSDNTLTELPGMDQPADYPIGYNPMGLLVTRKRKWDEYYEHIESLRTIACSPECRGLWKPGDKLEEGKDYELRLHYHAPDDKELTAFPLPVKSEDDLYWYAVIALVRETRREAGATDALVKILKENYSLTKR